jgi:membrane protein
MMQSKVKSSLKDQWNLLQETTKAWSARDPFHNSIIIAYYTIFSMPGLLLVIVTSVGFFFSREEITTQITSQIQSVMGGDTAKDISSILLKARETQDTLLSSIIGIATLLFGATGVFYELQQMFNRIWQVPLHPKPKTKHKIITLIRDRLFSFGLILIIGFLLLVSLLLSAGLSAVSAWVTLHWSEALNSTFRLFDILLSLGIITLLFAALFKFLPDSKITWREVWRGALLTALLFVIAKFALGYYFGKTHLSSMYGAAGTIILIMLWVSYTGLILLFGAEYTYLGIQRAKKKNKSMNRHILKVFTG